MACQQVELRAVGIREKLREGQPQEAEHHSHEDHPDHLEPPAPNYLVRYVRGEEKFYILEQKDVLVLGQPQHLQCPDECAHMEPLQDTMQSREGTLHITSIAITYRGRGRVIVGHVVILCVNLSWMLHIACHSHRPRDALPMSALLVITSHIRDLRYDTHG